MARSLLVASMIPVVFAFSQPDNKKTTRHDLKARNYEISFAEYCTEYDKSYKGAEYVSRKATFEASLSKIRAHNEQQPLPSWFMGLSEHVDKTGDEWKAMKGLHRGHFHSFLRMKLAMAPMAVAQVKEMPGELDWRSKNVVTPVKDQGGCGSCWAFSSTETVESALGMAQLGKAEDVNIPILAPQQLVDCAPNPEHCGGSGGCQGSIQPLAFKYLIDAGGMDVNSDYAYKARDGKCKAPSLKPKVGITSYVEIPTNDYNATMNALVTAGPLAISVDASWSFYEEGVFSPPSSGIHTTIDHAVQLVGFGTEAGKDYWLVRNSWGAGWGEGGYIKLQKFGNGKEPCGIDKRPKDGFGCDGGPSTITVCGTSGMLSGSSYVLGAHLL